METTLQFYNRLKDELYFLDDFEKIKIKDETIDLLASQIQMLYNVIIALSESYSQDFIKHLIIDILKKPDFNNGKVYEALIYNWLITKQINFEAQAEIPKEDCYKSSNDGYYADGMITPYDIVFDVKRFGFITPPLQALREKIQKKISPEYYLTIEGGKNMSVDDIRDNFIEKAAEIATAIFDSSNKVHTDYIYKDKTFGIEFRAWERKSNTFITTLTEFNIYEWAYNNELYFMHHSSQFCRNKPYIIFCPFDERIAPMFHCDDISTSLALRVLCRRMFINLQKCDGRKINELDGKAVTDVTVATASRKISAIAFIDVSKEYEYSNCRTFVFQNPNADCKLSRYQVDQLFRYYGAFIDDFKFDNY